DPVVIGDDPVSPAHRKKGRADCGHVDLVTHGAAHGVARLAHRHPCSEDGQFAVGDGGDVTHAAVQDHPGHTAGSGCHGQDLVDVAVLGLSGHVDHERRTEGSLGHAHVQGEVVSG